MRVGMPRPGEHAGVEHLSSEVTSGECERRRGGQHYEGEPRDSARLSSVAQQPRACEYERCASPDGEIAVQIDRACLPTPFDEVPCGRKPRRDCQHSGKRGEVREQAAHLRRKLVVPNASVEQEQESQGGKSEREVEE